MAYGKNTNILNIVKSDKSNKMSKAEKALSEKNPLAGGTIKGSQYFSHLRPEGKGREKYKDYPSVRFNVEDQNIIDNVFRINRTKKDISEAQNRLVELGYLHHSEIDGNLGEQTRKALNRLQTNMNKDPEAIYHAMRDINIFKRD